MNDASSSSSLTPFASSRCTSRPTSVASRIWKQAIAARSPCRAMPRRSSSGRPAGGTRCASASRSSDVIASRSRAASSYASVSLARSMRSRSTFTAPRDLPPRKSSSPLISAPYSATGTLPRQGPWQRFRWKRRQGRCSACCSAAIGISQVRNWKRRRAASIAVLTEPGPVYGPK